jgi:hypothetical protein
MGRVLLRHEFLLVRWTFGRAVSEGLTNELVGLGARVSGWPLLHLPTGWKLRCRLNDDFTGLNKHTIAVQGVKLDLPSTI